MNDTVQLLFFSLLVVVLYNQNNILLFGYTNILLLSISVDMIHLLWYIYIFFWIGGVIQIYRNDEELMETFDRNPAPVRYFKFTTDQPNGTNFYYDCTIDDHTSSAQKTTSHYNVKMFTMLSFILLLAAWNWLGCFINLLSYENIYEIFVEYAEDERKKKRIRIKYFGQMNLFK